MEICFASDETTTVSTVSGKVRGYYSDDLYIFKGIPYAAAGRFQAPHAVTAWENVFDATSFGYVCPLLQQERPSGELMVPHRYWLMDENCQNLNVWTPGLDNQKRPVLVWLHGGGFSAGSAIEQLAYEGENMSRLGNVVVVSINHRLNILGYMDLSDYGKKYEDSGNAGGNDIIAALRWIRENIAGFGGDPENVTVFGQSGGGGKVTALLQSPGADGLFHKGVVMSGVLSDAMLGAGSGDARPLVQAMLAELNLTEKDVEQLEKIPYASLAQAYNKVAPGLKQKGHYTGCMPRPGSSYAGDPLMVGFREETAHIPLMVGTVFGEFDFLPLTYDKRTLNREKGIEIVKERLDAEDTVSLIRMFEQAYPERNPVDLLSLDTLFRPATMQYIRKRGQSGKAPVYSYQFNLDFLPEHGKAAWHCSDIPYFFHNTRMAPALNIPGVTEKLEEQMFGCLMAFAETGNPNHPGIPVWESSTGTEEKTLLFGKEVVSRTNFDEKLIPAFQPVAAEYMRKRMESAQILH